MDFTGDTDEIINVLLGDPRLRAMIREIVKDSDKAPDNPDDP